MNSSNRFNVRGTLSVVVAAAIVGLSGLVFEKGHTTVSRDGTIEVGQLTPVDFLPQVAELPAVIVSAPRLAVADRPAQGRA